MAIIVRLDRMMADRKVSLTSWRTSGDHAGQPFVLKTGKAKAVRFSTLEAICREQIASRAYWSTAPMQLDVAAAGTALRPPPVAVTLQEKRHKLV